VYLVESEVFFSLCSNYFFQNIILAFNTLNEVSKLVVGFLVVGAVVFDNKTVIWHNIAPKKLIAVAVAVAVAADTVVVVAGK
jgi:hypothetical protein